MNETQLRICKICGAEKTLEEFPLHGANKNCHLWKCRDCYNACQRKYRANYSEEVKQKLAEYQKKYRQKNKEKLLAQGKEYREKNREKILKQKREYSQKQNVKEYRKKYQAEYRKSRRARDPTYDAIIKYRYQLTSYIKEQGHKSNCASRKMIGCEWHVFWERMLMTWKEKYGRDWSGESYQIDHIVPLATAQTPEEVYSLFNYKNLQMLTPEDNINKARMDRFGWQHEQPNKG